MLFEARRKVGVRHLLGGNCNFAISKQVSKGATQFLSNDRKCAKGLSRWRETFETMKFSRLLSTQQCFSFQTVLEKKRRLKLDFPNLKTGFEVKVASM